MRRRMFLNFLKKKKKEKEKNNSSINSNQNSESIKQKRMSLSDILLGKKIEKNDGSEFKNDTKKQYVDTKNKEINEKNEDKKNEQKSQNTNSNRKSFNDIFVSKNLVNNEEDKVKNEVEKQLLNKKEKEKNKKNEEKNESKENCSFDTYDSKYMGRIFEEVLKRHQNDNICCIYTTKSNEVVKEIQYGGYKLVPSKQKLDCEGFFKANVNKFVIFEGKDCYKVVYKNFLNKTLTLTLSGSQYTKINGLLSKVLFSINAAAEGGNGNVVGGGDVEKKKVVKSLIKNCPGTRLLQNTYYLISGQGIEEVSIYVKEGKNGEVIRSVICNENSGSGDAVKIYKKYTKKLQDLDKKKDWNENFVEMEKEERIKITCYVHINPGLYQAMLASENKKESQCTLPSDFFRGLVFFKLPGRGKVGIDGWKELFEKIEVFFAKIPERQKIIKNMQEELLKTKKSVVVGDGCVYIQENFTNLTDRDRDFYAFFVSEIIWYCWYQTLSQKNLVSFAEFLNLAYYYKDNASEIDNGSEIFRVRRAIKNIWQEISDLLSKYSQTTYASGFYFFLLGLGAIRISKVVDNQVNEYSFLLRQLPQSYWTNFIFSQSGDKKEIKSAQECKLNEQKLFLEVNVYNDEIKKTALKIMDITCIRQTQIIYETYDLSLAVAGLCELVVPFDGGANIIVKNHLFSDEKGGSRSFVGNIIVGGNEFFRYLFMLALKYDIPALTAECRRMLDPEVAKDLKHLLEQKEKYDKDIRFVENKKNETMKLLKKEPEVQEETYGIFELDLKLKKQIEQGREKIKKKIKELFLTSEKNVETSSELSETKHTNSFTAFPENSIGKIKNKLLISYYPNFQFSQDNSKPLKEEKNKNEGGSEEEIKVEKLEDNDDLFNEENKQNIGNGDNENNENLSGKSLNFG